MYTIRGKRLNVKPAAPGGPSSVVHLKRWYYCVRFGSQVPPPNQNPSPARWTIAIFTQYSCRFFVRPPVAEVRECHLVKHGAATICGCELDRRGRLCVGSRKRADCPPTSLSTPSPLERQHHPRYHEWRESIPRLVSASQTRIEKTIVHVVPTMSR